VARTVLFLCTGNYYRSRFAETLFHHLAAEQALDWSATSRGLAIELNGLNFGPVSPHTLQHLRSLGIDCDVQRTPVRCSESDLCQADLVIAVKEAEHRPLLQARHAGWEGRVIYWHIHDVDGTAPDQALSEIQSLVGDLVRQLIADAAGARR